MFHVAYRGWALPRGSLRAKSVVEKDFVLFPSLVVVRLRFSFRDSVVQGCLHFTVHNMRVVVGDVFVIFVLIVDGVIPLGVVEVVVDVVVAVVQVFRDSRVGREKSNLEFRILKHPSSIIFFLQTAMTIKRTSRSLVSDTNFSSSKASTILAVSSSLDPNNLLPS